ncbi:MAG: hypothetical protein GX616_23110, partial [Planctomycetes bacterium]|nr:hypothetical protein [Planctomycetota bacterium]
MKTLFRLPVIVTLLVVLGLAGPAYASQPALAVNPAGEARPALETNVAGLTTVATVNPIPWDGPTALPEYIGAPAKAHPLAPAHVPQNPFLAPNPFNYVHN